MPTGSALRARRGDSVGGRREPLVESLSASDSAQAAMWPQKQRGPKAEGAQSRGGPKQSGLKRSVVQRERANDLAEAADALSARERATHHCVKQVQISLVLAMPLVS